MMQKGTEAESVHWTGETDRLLLLSSIQSYKRGKIHGVICQMARLRLNSLAL